MAQGEGGGAPRVNKISLRRAVAEVASDDDIRNIARGLVAGAFDDDGRPRMDAINALIKLLPHVPSSGALDRAKVLAASSVQDTARLAIDVLVAHVLEEQTPEAASALIEALTRWKNADGDSGANTGNITLNIVPHDGSTVTVTKTEEEITE